MKVQELDLSDNLIEDWQQICSLARALPCLRSLVVRWVSKSREYAEGSGNRFSRSLVRSNAALVQLELDRVAVSGEQVSVACLPT